jgi:hypothetical protein
MKDIVPGRRKRPGKDTLCYFFFCKFPKTSFTIRLQYIHPNPWIFFSKCVVAELCADEQIQKRKHEGT